MKAEIESIGEMQDVPMTDAPFESNSIHLAASITASNPVQPLPANRFDLELEFIQSLASPAYLHYLAITGILYQSSFLDFLRYLRYWKKPQYSKYLMYPNCLYFLDLLVPPEDNEDDCVDDNEQKSKKGDAGEAFRREMAQVQFRNFVHEQQFYSWQFRSGRLYGRGLDLKGDDKGNLEANGGESV